MQDFKQLSQTKNFDEYYEKFIRPEEYKIKLGEPFISRYIISIVKLINQITRILFFSTVVIIVFIPLLAFLKVIDIAVIKNMIPYIIFLWPWLFLIFLISIFCLVFKDTIILRRFKKLSNSLKTFFLPKILEYFGNNFKYFLEVDTEIIKKIKSFSILPSYKYSQFEDLIVGNFNQTSLVIVDALLETEIDNEKTTVFNGICMLVEMNKSFNQKTIVKRDRLKVVAFPSYKGYERVTLEDPTFENKFNVYSSDQIEARYLLSPNFIQKFLDLAELFSNQIECSFFENKLLITIDKKADSFEFNSIFKKTDYYQDCLSVMKQINSLLEIIEILKLDEKTKL